MQENGQNTRAATAPDKVVIIPAYEPTENFILYLKELTETDICAVIVVNDGSNETFDAIFSQVETMPKCTLLRHDVNRGKGAALKTAFDYCLVHFPENTVYVTADSDGQHLVNDVLRVAEEAAEYPDALVLGTRNFNKAGVPFRSRWGNRWTSLFFRFVHGIKVKDTQTGLRGFSYGLLTHLLDINGDRFEYEMNMLIATSKWDVPLRQVPIETVYNTEGLVSHFQTLRDSGLIMRAVFGSLGMYFLSSLISAVADVLIFLFLNNVIDIPGIFGCPVAWHVPIAKGVARVLSSIINVYFNFRYVFHGKGALSIVKYYILWACQLVASSAGVTLMIEVLHVPQVLSVIIVDLTLALISYQIQKHWVFKNKEVSR